MNSERKWKHYLKYDPKTPYSLFLIYFLLIQFAPSTPGSLAGTKIESLHFTPKFWLSIGFIKFLKIRQLNHLKQEKKYNNW